MPLFITSYTKYLKNSLIYFTLFVIAFITGTAEGYSQFRYGLRLGGIFDSYALHDTKEYYLKDGSGFNGGLVIEYQLPGTGFAPDFALLYTRHHVKIVDIENTSSDKLPVNYIDLPLHLKYKIPAGILRNIVEPLVYTGPTFAFRLGKSSILLPTEVFQPRWDIGVGFDIANFIALTGGYTFGLKNVVSYGENGPSLKTNGWNIAVNIMFDF